MSAFLYVVHFEQWRQAAHLRLGHTIVLVLAQLASCASHLCSLATAEFGPQPFPARSSSANDVSPLPNDGFVLLESVAGTDGQWTIVSIAAGAREDVVRSADLYPTHDEALVTGNAGWWFSRRASLNGTDLIEIIAGSKSEVSRTQLDLPNRQLILWLPLAANEPGGIALSRTGADTVQIDEIRSSGIRERASFSWPMGRGVLIPSSKVWSAERLPDERIVLTSIESPERGPRSLMMRVVGENVETRHLPCRPAIHRLIATAVDPRGRVAILGVSSASEVVGMIVHPDQPDAAVCRVLSAPGEAGDVVAVEWSGDTFIGAWMTTNGAIRACNLDRQTPPVVVTVAEDADSARPMGHLMQMADDRVVFLWRSRDGRILVRRIPPSLEGHEVISRLCRSLSIRC